LMLSCQSGDTKVTFLVTIQYRDREIRGLCGIATPDA
jgi:hypothetical protein